MTDLNTLITELDPAQAVLIIPLDGETAATRVAEFDASLRRYGRLRPIGIVVATALLLGAAVGYVTLAGPRPRSSATKTMLARLAAVTTQDVTALGPGQYLYTKSEEERRITLQESGLPAATATYTEAVQSWISSVPGKGQVVTTPTGSLTFSSAQDQARWEADPLSATVQWPGGTRTGPPSATQTAFNVSSLPPDPTTLAHLLADGQTGIPRLDEISGNDPAFARAIALLFTSAVGVTPALEAATYKVLETLPRVQITGSSDNLGRSAAEISVPGTTAHVLVDQSTGQPLELAETWPVRTLTTSPLRVILPTGKSSPPVTSGRFSTSMVSQTVMSQSVMNSLAPPTTGTTTAITRRRA